MKCSAPFILSYNRLFRFLEEKGYPELESFWSLLEDAVLGQLRYLAATKGFGGMIEYWSQTLTAEKAVFDIRLVNTDDDKSVVINIFRCPSLRVIEEAGEVPCMSYCQHCFFLYNKALNPLGYEFCVTPTGSGCLIRIHECDKMD